MQRPIEAICSVHASRIASAEDTLISKLEWALARFVTANS
jgi:hypothetical protein